MEGSQMRRAIAAAVLYSIGVVSASAQEPSSAPAQPKPARDQSAESRFLSFDELVELSSNAHPSGELENRLNALLATPFVNNDATKAGIAPHRPDVVRLGPVLRV